MPCCSTEGGVAVGQPAQLRGAIAGKRRAVHDREGLRLQIGELVQGWLKRCR
jgi:hypothetical protein